MTIFLTTRYRARLSVILVLTLLAFHGSATAKESFTDELSSNEGMLMGAGAHFAWIVFDALKEDLEKKTGRKTIIFV